MAKKKTDTPAPETRGKAARTPATTPKASTTKGKAPPGPKGKGR